MSLPSLLDKVLPIGVPLGVEEETKPTVGVVGSGGVEILSLPTETKEETPTTKTEEITYTSETTSGITALKIDETYFHSGWRPTFCWLSIFTLFYYILIRPIANLGLTLAGLPTFEGIDPTILEVLLYSLTGFGIARSLDKKKKL